VSRTGAVAPGNLDAELAGGAFSFSVVFCNRLAKSADMLKAVSNDLGNARVVGECGGVGRFKGVFVCRSLNWLLAASLLWIRCVESREGLRGVSRSVTVTDRGIEVR
jgi:hypothetical protein